LENGDWLVMKKQKLMKFLSQFRAAGFLCAGALMLSGCAAEKFDPEHQTGEAQDNPTQIDYSKKKTILGEGGLNIFGSNDSGQGSGGALGVNSFLWRASLDTISFMPVNSADPFGGVIITDWHTPTEAPSERFKLNVYILGRVLRADGVRVAVFRQVQSAKGGWKDAGVPNETGTKIEDAILIRARQLRNQSIK
jgi:hypothetical protein